MNFKWTMDHTKGLGIGIVTPLLFIPVILLVLSWVQNYDFGRLWHEFNLNDKYHIKIISLSLISNLIWFYFFLNREIYNIARGVILGTLAFGPYMVYIKFF